MPTHIHRHTNTQKYRPHRRHIQAHIGQGHRYTESYEDTHTPKEPLLALA